MAHFPLGGLVIKALVVILRVLQAYHHVAYAEKAHGVELFVVELFDLVIGATQPFFAVKQRGLVHIVPESLDPHIGQPFILVTEPARGFRVEKIGQQAFARPYADDKVLAVFIFAEVAFCMSFVIDVIALFFFDGGVNDGDQPDSALLHLSCECFEVREPLRMHGKVLEVVHIVDIEVDHVKGDTGVLIAVRAAFDILLRRIAPAALPVAERPQRRHIALADQRSKLADDPFQAVAGNDVQIEREVFGRDAQHIAVGVADIKGDLARCVKERAETLLTVDEEEVVRAVDRALFCGMEGLVGAPALIDPSALVDAAQGFAESVNARILSHPQEEGVIFYR